MKPAKKLFVYKLKLIPPLATSTSVNNCYVKYVKLINFVLFIGPTHQYI